jgi:hypothetical protein
MYYFIQLGRCVSEMPTICFALGTLDVVYISHNSLLPMVVGYITTTHNHFSSAGAHGNAVLASVKWA